METQKATIRMDTFMELFERIKIIRGFLKQKEFALKLGVSKVTIGRWERGERVPDAQDLFKITVVFPEINPTWLLTGEGEMNRGSRERELEDKFFQIPFRDTLQIVVTQALIELASPGIKEEHAKKTAGLCLEVMNVLGQGREAVPPISYIRRIVKLVAMLYDFYDMDEGDTEAFGITTQRITKMVEKLADKGKSKSLTNEEERAEIQRMVDEMNKEDKGEDS